MARFTEVGALILILLVIFFITQSERGPKDSLLVQKDLPLKIASYNMKNFGLTKASNPELMNSYQQLIKKYDVIFLQEITDETGQAFESLCKSLKDYNCIISSRAGSTIHKEQYAILFKRVNFTEIYDFNLYNYSDSFERPPLKATMIYSNISLVFYVNHIKPDSAEEEINRLEQIIIQDEEEFKVILGDLNMDCTYYNNVNFVNYKFLVTDDMDTTTGTTNCAYDRIIVTPQTYLLAQNFGVDYSTNSEMSDHYPVFFELSTP